MKSRLIAGCMALLVLSLPVVLAGELNLIYDANGNLVTGDGIYREYNSLNQLWKVYNGSDSNGVLLQEYMHEPGEERVLMKKTFNESGLVETVYYPFKELTRVVNSSGTYDFTNVYHEGQLVAVRHPDGTKEFYHPDHLGSTTLVTDESGNEVETTEYSPFGVILEGGEQSRYDYEGKEFDEITGQFDFHFRGYKAEWGKFTQSDGVISNLYDPRTLNHYSFEQNNPYKYIDPNGLWTLQVGVSPGGGVVVGGQGEVGIAIGSDHILPNQIGVYASGGGGVHAGLSGGVGLTLTGSKSRYLSDLRGFSLSQGGSVNVGYRGGLATNIPLSDRENGALLTTENLADTSISVTPIGIGASLQGAEVHSYLTYTWVPYFGPQRSEQADETRAETGSGRARGGGSRYTPGDSDGDGEQDHTPADPCGYIVSCA